MVAAHVTAKITSLKVTIGEDDDGVTRHGDGGVGVAAVAVEAGVNLTAGTSFDAGIQRLIVSGERRKRQGK